MIHVDDFSVWHRCQRWIEKGLDCPFRPLEDEKEPSEPEGDASARNTGADALAEAVGGVFSREGLLGAGKFLGPLLALFTIMRAVQTGGGLPIGTVSRAGFAEEATTRVLSPRVPAREGPTPARPTPGRAPVPVGSGRSPAPRGGGGGGFFVNQAAEMKRLIGR